MTRVHGNKFTKNEEIFDEINETKENLNGEFEKINENLNGEFEKINENQEPVEEDLKTGVIVNCLFLRIRKEPSKESEVLKEVSCLEELKLDLEKSTKDFYKVHSSSGVDGYCMKDFIVIKG